MTERATGRAIAKRDMTRTVHSAKKRHAARRAARTAVTSRFVVLTGLSGSGKSQAIRALEDLGYFCVDNLPVALLPMLAELTLRAGSEIARAAVVVDVREGKMLNEFPAIYRQLKAMREPEPGADLPRGGRAVAGAAVQRDAPAASAGAGSIGDRRHPRGAQGDAWRSARMADHIVDTSEMTVHELRHAFTGVASGRAPGSQLVVTILSFGFKHGIPVDSDLLFDVRFLPNPHFVPELRPHTGRDREVVRSSIARRRDARVPRAHAEPAEVPDPAVRARREDVPDDRHRLHRRPPPLGGDCGGAEEGAVRDCRACGSGSTHRDIANDSDAAHRMSA